MAGNLGDPKPENSPDTESVSQFAAKAAIYWGCYLLAAVLVLYLIQDPQMRRARIKAIRDWLDYRRRQLRYWLKHRSPKGLPSAGLPAWVLHLGETTTEDSEPSVSDPR